MSTIIRALGLVLAFAAAAAAAPNVTNATQKGSLLIFPDIDVRGNRSTLVRLMNDGSLSVDVKCIWMDGNKNRTDFVITVTRNQAVWFDARTGEGTVPVNVFPMFAANGFDNPYLGGANADPYGAGLLACFAVQSGDLGQLKWNHLSGDATVYDAVAGTAYQYSAYGFFVLNGTDQNPIGTPGLLVLNGVDYDACPLYAIGQISPVGTQATFNTTLDFLSNRLAVSGCSLLLNQDWTPVFTKLQFDVWNGDEVKFTGAFECADSWHETDFTDLDSAAMLFDRTSLGTDTARYRVQAVKSTQCPGSQATGLLTVQSTNLLMGPRLTTVGSTLSAAGKFQGKIVWDPSIVVPEVR